MYWIVWHQVARSTALAVKLALLASSAPALAQQTGLNGLPAFGAPTLERASIQSNRVAGPAAPWHGPREDSRLGLAEPREESGNVTRSIGRLGFEIDDSGTGSRLKGLAWSPGRSVRVVARGKLGSGNGIVPNLSVQLRF